MAAAPKTFGFVIKNNEKKATALAKEVEKWLIKKKCKVVIADKTVPKEALPTSCDMILVFGGDGTFLSIAKEMLWKSIPILGVNLGQLGFLTEVKVDEVYDTLALVLKGKYKVSERSMLEGCVKRKGKELFCLPVLNDVVITKSAIARMIDFSLTIDGIFVADLKADGLIVATPTGSTAYSLAAGGPIIKPSVQAIVVTAICPHSLTVRPFVIPDTSEIEIVLSKKHGDIMITLDGQFGYDLQQGDIVKIRTYKQHKLKIVQSPKREYFSLLRAKLSLGARGEPTC